MATFQYRALTSLGEVVTGAIEAPDLAEVHHRIEYLGLIPVEASASRDAKPLSRGFSLKWRSQPRAEEVTIFTADLALLMRTGARINDALELLATDADIGRMRPVTAALATAVLSGESFGEAVARHPKAFPPIYAALVGVGETSGALVPALEALAAERQRSEALSRQISDALRYPAFLFVAAAGVLLFFLLAVLPQFAGVFRDFNAKLDPVLVTFIGLSDMLRNEGQTIAAGALALLLAAWIGLRQPSVRGRAVSLFARLPIARSIMEYRRTALFCRNLGLLLTSGVPLAAALRVLSQTMEATGQFGQWATIVDKVRHGGKLSDALTATAALPPMAVRTLRLGEDSGQLPHLAGRIADFYEVKLKRSLDRAVGVVGPAAIIFISIIVGGLIISVITALLSVNQVVG